jgi:hypothetical protein
VLRLQPLPAGQKQIKRFVPVVPIEQMLPQVQKHVPGLSWRAAKQILNDAGGIVPPGIHNKLPRLG